jgi:hypothetical protein
MPDSNYKTVKVEVDRIFTFNGQHLGPGIVEVPEGPLADMFRAKTKKVMTDNPIVPREVATLPPGVPPPPR